MPRRVGKYERLKRYLMRRPAERLEMTFRDIERVIGDLLPNSANLPEWWTDEASAVRSHVQLDAWRDAGFEARLITGKDRVVFHRIGRIDRR
ncbi:MAG: hypothetical protein JO303_18445 [Caulobacteraceae bacterium]|nr:hypothetical protein [Caulobacteraceae bacterium]